MLKDLVSVVTLELHKKNRCAGPSILQAISSKGYSLESDRRSMLPSSSLENSKTPDAAELTRQIQGMGDWFHNINLHGVYTAPNHFLGDFPNIKWSKVRGEIPLNLEGASVLDIGCNAGFYSIEMKRRGASHVLGIDVDDRYLNQARFAAQTLGLEIEFRRCSVYELDSIPGQFDFVVFMGVFYHLRYPLLGLDLAVKKVGGKLIFQTMLRGSKEAPALEGDYPIWHKDVFLDPRFPAMYFIEKKYSSDPTNWWIPNCAAAEAMLRSSGLEIIGHPEEETWICSPTSIKRQGRYVVDLEFAGELVPPEGDAPTW
jgi:tRNA (mo5U34)-methyltransferase